MEKIYGDKDARSIFSGGCGSKLFFSGMDTQMCDYVEKALGQNTEYDTLYQGISEHARTVARPLMRCDEVRMMDTERRAAQWPSAPSLLCDAEVFSAEGMAGVDRKGGGFAAIFWVPCGISFGVPRETGSADPIYSTGASAGRGRVSTRIHIFGDEGGCGDGGDGVMKIRWENDERGRYYLVHLHRDLLGDWCLTRVWGRKGSSLGQIRHDQVETEQAGREMIKKIAVRRRQRGYRVREGDMEVLSLSNGND